jgi:hypothetical protein
MEGASWHEWAWKTGCKQTFFFCCLLFVNWLTCVVQNEVIAFLLIWKMWKMEVYVLVEWALKPAANGQHVCCLKSAHEMLHLVLLISNQLQEMPILHLWPK